MKSARIASPRKIEIVDEKIPAVTENRALVRLLKVAICGSDLPYFYKEFSASSYPLPSGYPGHECLGVIEEPGNSGFRRGDRVMYYPADLDAFKEYHVADASRLQKLPETGDLNILLMTQLLGAVAHAAFRIESPYNKSVVVMGQGPVGLLFTALMKNLGAKKIIAVDPLDYRLKVSLNMGADITFNPEKLDVMKEVYKSTDGRFADIVIDAYGQKVEVINQCFDLARHNGQVAFFGICLEEYPGLNFSRFFRKELRMVSSVGPDISTDYPYALDMILNESIDVSKLITHVMPFDKIQSGFDIASERLENVIKVVLDF
jgi:threonine 3-dehydrogenase